MTEPHIAGRQTWQMRIRPAENPFKRGLIMAVKIYAHLATVLVLVTMGLQYWSGLPITLIGAQVFCFGQLDLINEMAKPHDQYRGLRLIPSALLMLLGGAFQAYQTFHPPLS
ncbi:MAG: hypothetical protein NTX20_00035 [Verrucomicrobia bacterium]|nr:hypothetical protein [Verrucomicrobiota bacterium]